MKLPTLGLLIFLALAASQVVGAQTRPAPKTKPPAPKTPSFAKDVLPIFRTACIGCHGETNPGGGLTLTSYAGLLKGGKGPALLVPGKGSESRLVKLLTGTEQPQMPPGGALNTPDIDRVRAWIDAGAKEGAPVQIPVGKVKKRVALPAPHANLPAAPGAILSVPTPVTSLAFSPDGKTLVVGVYRQVQFWDAASRLLLRTWNGHVDAVHALVFSKDGKWLAAGGGRPGVSGEVRLWEVATSHEERVIGDQTDIVNGLAFSPDGKYLASGSADKSVKIWETATGKSLAALREHADTVYGLAYTPDGKYLASASGDRSVKVWDTATWKRRYSIGAHSDIIADVLFSPDGKNLLSISADKTAKVWAFGADGSSAVRTLGGHSNAVLAAALSSDGKNLATASADKSVKVWTVADGNNIRTLTDAKDWVYAVRFNPDGKLLAAGTWDGSVLLWNVADGKLEGQLSTGNKR